MQRPTAVTVFGILNIGFAALGILGMFASIALFFLPADTNNPVIRIIHENGAYALWLKICIPLGILSSLALLAAGIGLLRLKSWARTLSIGYAIYAIVFGLLGIAVNFVFLVEPLLKESQRQQGPEAAGAAIGGAIGGSFGGCIGMIYPVLLLIFMTRPAIVAAFRSPTPPPL